MVDNVPRVLPDGLTAIFQSAAWTVPPVFRLIQQKGGVAREEMYHVFNMGIGMVVICSSENVDQLLRALPEAKVIGEVVKQAGKARVVIE